MDILLGVLLALATGISGTVIAFDRERGFYPLILIVIATYYVLFAIMGTTPGTWMPESLAALVFVAIGVIGYKGSSWIVVAGFVAHGLFDLLHGQLVDDPGVPSFWPRFCLGYDLVVAGYLCLLLLRRTSSAAQV